MKPIVRWIVLAAAVAVVVVLFVALRPGASDGPGGAGASTSHPTSSGSGGASPTASGTGAEIDVTVRSGQVDVRGSTDVSLGDRVRIVVDADVSDEVHVHGYDLMQDVTPQEPAVIDLVASAPGVFEVELEGAGKELFQLQVTP